MGLTPKELVVAQIRHEQTEPLPYTIRFEPGVAERLDAYYGSTAWRSLVDSAIERLPGPMESVAEAPGPLYRDVYGSLWRTDLRPFYLVEPALKTASLDDYEFPSMDVIFGPGWEEEVHQGVAQRKDHFVVISFGFGLWERSWTMRGFDEALMDAAGDPDFFAELTGRIAQHQLAIIDRLVKLPVDGIMFSDDWGYQQGVLLGPERWRCFHKPHLARMYARVHEAKKYTLSHCCGSMVDIMEDIIEIGLDVLESVQPEARGMNPYELKRRFGDRITFWGGLGSQSVIPFGTPAEIRAEVKKLCREMGRGGGYILSPAKPLQPETPAENAAAVVEAFLHQAGVSLTA